MDAESVRGEDSILHGPEDNGNIKLDVADLGPTDLLLKGNGWSIPVHRYGTALGFNLLPRVWPKVQPNPLVSALQVDSLYILHMLRKLILVGLDSPDDQLTAGFPGWSVLHTASLKTSACVWWSRKVCSVSGAIASAGHKQSPMPRTCTHMRDMIEQTCCQLTRLCGVTTLGVLAGMC